MTEALKVLIIEDDPDIRLGCVQALQERSLERLGSNTSIPINCRVIAATKEDLRNLAEQGRWSESGDPRPSAVAAAGSGAAARQSG